MYNKLVFLCGARDFHAMDWYKSALELKSGYEIIIVTDLIAGEGYKKIVSDNDNVHRLLILDNLLFSKQSSIGHLWRNLLKLLVLPIQVLLLKKFNNENHSCIYHAHSMYYLVLARAARVEYVGTPQGSDILVKPLRSRFFKWFAKYGLQKAKEITVDSENMKSGVKNLVNRDAIIIQNGIDLTAIQESLDLLKTNTKAETREGVLSVRGFTPLYRIKNILSNRYESKNDFKITFIYPFSDDNYKIECNSYIQSSDIDLGRVDRIRMYQLMHEAKLVVSIPLSDSSPRSVYEAIFCGAPVAITYNNYYELLPKSMKDRIIIVDLSLNNWLQDALIKAEDILGEQFVPDQEALEMFDQRKSFKKMETILFN